MMRVQVVRVQDAEGRGPWRAGFSQRWIDDDAPVGRLTETVMDLVPVERLRALPPDLAYGCGCRTVAGLVAWFTPKERATLARFGFHIVAMQVDVVLAESPWQIVFGRRLPLAVGASRRRWPS